MRMRRKKNLDTRLLAQRGLFVDASACVRGEWAQKTGSRPLFVEVGCGKGQFITEMAMQYPGCFFVAVEKFANVIVHAMERAAALGLGNLLFISADAAQLGEFFAEDEVSGVYINFPDPWPPKRYWKRRLTHRNMLGVFSALLAPDSFIRLKTDDRGLFEFSLCELSQSGFVLSDVSLDLHSTDSPNVMTEYETRFSERGCKILALTARREG